MGILFIVVHTLNAPTLTGSAFVQRDPSEKCADLCLSRQQDNDDEISVESQPLFEDVDSAAWASFSSNVKIACESLSSVPVRTFQAFVLMKSVFGLRHIFQ